jgi:hypothetical protein
MSNLIIQSIKLTPEARESLDCIKEHYKNTENIALTIPQIVSLALCDSADKIKAKANKDKS